jgi:HD-GYP domain-containing protein (c-di-GMP phosphodiesterase class II)
MSIEVCVRAVDLTLVKRVPSLPKSVSKTLGLAGASELHPAMEDAIERHGESQKAGLDKRERTSEISLAIATLAAAAALAALGPEPQAFDPWLAGALVVAFAVAHRVRFHDGAGYAIPTQLVLVPMLLLLPPAVVPLLVALAMTLGNIERCVRADLHPHRVVLSLGDATYTLAPALVLALAGPDVPSWSALPLYIAALVAQLGFDSLLTLLRDWFVSGMGVELGLSVLAWTWLVDTILSTVGLLAALAARDAPFGALLVLPLLGLLSVFSRERTARIDQSLELSRAYRGTTLLLSDVLDDDDEYTAFHSRGVVQLSIAVADRLGLDERVKRNVEFGALLHDIGKIAIPKEILNKPGKLSPDEWVVMETHTVEGQRLLDRVGGVLHDVGQIVRSSHERWDGGGYPDGLVGDAIPIESSIVSVCDAFSAMTTDRPYRKALSVETAIQELRDNAGTQFCPPAVEALIALIEENADVVGPRNVAEEIELMTLTVPALSPFAA